ncbi:MAG: phosphatase PAP2 family protein [Candidatus Firestonebacteria bacterium]
MQNFFDFIIGIDRQVFYFCNNTLRNTFFDFVMPIITSEWWVLPLVLVAAILLIYGNRRVKIIVVLIIIAIAFADTICYRILKPFFARIRPFYTLGHVNLLTGAGYLSFPSNHAANTFALSSVVFLFNKKGGAWLLCSSAVISFSRIYCGVHYPLDVLAGAFIGSAIGVMTVFFYRQFKWKKETKPR